MDEKKYKEYKAKLDRLDDIEQMAKAQKKELMDQHLKEIQSAKTPEDIANEKDEELKENMDAAQEVLDGLEDAGHLQGELDAIELLLDHAEIIAEWLDQDEDARTRFYTWYVENNKANE